MFRVNTKYTSQFVLSKQMMMVHSEEVPRQVEERKKKRNRTKDLPVRLGQDKMPLSSKPHYVANRSW